MVKDVKIEDKAKLQQEADSLRAELRKLRFDLALSQLDDTNKIRESKRRLANINTSLTKIKDLEMQAERGR